jgi:hypothetical protein
LIREIIFSVLKLFKTAAVIATLAYGTSTSGFALVFLLKGTNTHGILYKFALL